MAHGRLYYMRKCIRLLREEVHVLKKLYMTNKKKNEILLMDQQDYIEDLEAEIEDLRAEKTYPIFSVN